MSSLKGKTVLITGGTGSFGNKLLENLIKMDLKEIRILSRDELKQEIMRIEYANPKIKFFIGDVRDERSIQSAMDGVNLVFHAAALKQVPSCEFFPMQAVYTNIIGSHNVVETAIKMNVQKVICLSTDKAVEPVNVMGMSKALMEKTVLASARLNKKKNTIISRVRYGNVMYSRGSLIPLITNQILVGKPLTITRPEMTRFLMSLQEAIDLVIYSFEKANQGDLFIRKAPATTVLTIVEALKDIFNATNEIAIIGSRHGEKIHETLATAEELSTSEDHGVYFRIKMDERDLNYGINTDVIASNSQILNDYTSENTYRLSRDETKRLLLDLPEIQKILKGS
jgi:UDP-N-acetylglucosamine 4,6-dehydratase/5-epimerase